MSTFNWIHNVLTTTDLIVLQVCWDYACDKGLNITKLYCRWHFVKLSARWVRVENTGVCLDILDPQSRAVETCHYLTPREF